MESLVTVSSLISEFDTIKCTKSTYYNLPAYNIALPQSMRLRGTHDIDRRTMRYFANISLNAQEPSRCTADTQNFRVLHVGLCVCGCLNAQIGNISLR